MHNKLVHNALLAVDAEEALLLQVRFVEQQALGKEKKDKWNFEGNLLREIYSYIL